MTDIVSPLLQWLNANPEWAGVATFVISAGESVAIIGTLVPGSITMTAIGALAGAGVIPLWPTICWAILGAIVGDGISYWIGHYFKNRLRKMWPFRNNLAILKHGEIFVHKHGVMSVFIGRFVGPVRALIPLIAGMLGMKPLQFTIANVASAIGWAPVYMLPGILLGAASLELPPDIAVHVMLVLLLIGLFITMCIWTLYKLLQLIHIQTHQLQTSIWRQLQKSRYFSLVTVVLKHQNPHKTFGQLNLAFYFLLTSTLFAALAFYVKTTGPANIMVNDALFHFFRGVRNSTTDAVMVNITLLGQKQVILPIIGTLFILFAMNKRWRTAWHTLALGVLSAGSISILKSLIKSPRPWGILRSPDLYSLPSGHTTLAAVIYLGIAFLIANSMRTKRRWQIYFPCLLLVLAVSVSRLYLGAHWFTDVVCSWLLSIAILLLVVISYRRQPEKSLRAGRIIFVSLATLFVTFSSYQILHFNSLKAVYTQVSWPSIEIPMQQWWLHNGELPAYRTSLFGFPSLRINIEWVGSIEDIESTLRKEGWEKPPARDWISTLHRVADIKSTQYLPMISPQYLDQRPVLILTRQANGKRSLLVLRLWNSNRTIKENKQPVWVGIAGIVPRSYSWIFKKQQEEMNVDPVLLFPTHAGTGRWQWKVVGLYQPSGKKAFIHQRIMLIRPNKAIHIKQ